MARITLEGNPIETIGTLPEINTPAIPFTLTMTDFTSCSLLDFEGETVVLNIFPSIDTPVCAASVRRFNQEAASLADTVVLCVSEDLPFAHKRFCEGEGIADVIPLSAFRSPEFGQDYGVSMLTGPLAGLLARAVVIIDKISTVVYSELVPEIAREPDYGAALQHLK